MPVSNAGKNAIQAYGMKRFAYQPPATSTQEATNPPFFQNQSQAGADNSGGSAPQPGVRSRLLQTINPEPVRDVQEESRLKELAKINALGTALGSLGQLAGVAGGGDAVAIHNPTNDFILNKLTYLDDDYRNQVKDYTNRSFAMDRFNIQQQNQDISDENNRMADRERIQLQGQKEKEVAEYRAKLDLDKFFKMTKEEQNKTMAEIGIDPRAKDAFDQYIKRTNQNYGIDTNYRKSLTAENYANANKTNQEASNPKGKEEFPLETMKKGVGVIVNDLKKQLANVNNLPYQEREAARKQLQDEIAFWERQYNPKTNELLNERVLDAAQGAGGNSETPQVMGAPFTPGKGFSLPGNDAPKVTNPNTPDEQEIMSRMNANRTFVLDNAKRIAGIDLNNPDPETANMIIEKADELVELGVFTDRDSAIESILQLAKSNVK